MKEKKYLKRTRKIGVNLDRLIPNELFSGPNEDYEFEEKEQVEKTPEVDLEAVKKVAELEAAKKLAEEEKAKKLAEERALRKAAEEAEKARKLAEEEAARKAAEEAEKARKLAEEEALRKAAGEAEKARKLAEEEALRKAAEEAEKAKKLAEEKEKMEAVQRQQVSAVEVKTIISDETAMTLIEEEEETEKIYGNKKTIINLDTISANFEANDVVTVNVLKEKKLVDKNVYFVKVLARGVLDKPLTVKAQDFSIDAAKMIEITGGRVVMLTKKKYF